MENKSLSLNTIAVHGGSRRDDCFGAINEPIYMTSNYRIPTDGTPVDWSGTNSNIYQRNRNVNQMVLQDKLCAMTGAEGVSCVGNTFVIYRKSKKLEAQRAQEKAKERAAKKVNPVRAGIQKRRAKAKKDKERRDEFFRQQREKERREKK